MAEPQASDRTGLSLSLSLSLSPCFFFLSLSLSRYSAPRCVSSDGRAAAADEAVKSSWRNRPVDGRRRFQADDDADGPRHGPLRAPL